MGNLAWVLELDWSGKQQFDYAPMKPFILPNNELGGEGKTSTWKNEGRLTFLRLFDAGHMAPRDQPFTLQYMLDTFIATGGMGD